MGSALDTTMKREDWPLLFRSYLQMAEAVHPGPWRKFDIDVRDHLSRNDGLIGSDEHACEVCGVRNVKADGYAGRFMWGHNGRYFCQAHFAEFEKTFIDDARPGFIREAIFGSKED